MLFKFTTNVVSDNYIQHKELSLMASRFICTRPVQPVDLAGGFYLMCI